MATARRDSLLAAAIALGATALALWLVGVSSAPAAAAGDPRAHGKELFTTGCASCHGVDGTGVTTPDGKVRGPAITERGEASAYYELSTGRMPLADSDSAPERKRAVYGAEDIADLVVYVGSLGTGPKLPTVDVADADLALGGERFRAECAACHSASGAGGALSYGRAAPNLGQAKPLEVAAAVRAGPGQMPVFGADLDQAELNAVVRYVQYLRAPDDRGGFPIGRTGPVPEGFVALTFGIGALLAAVAWIGTRSPIRSGGCADEPVRGDGDG
ncbi:MAG: c-type cytochrome [Acidimicrobiales bacterium]